MLRKKVEAAVQSLKKGKSAGVGNMPAELIQAGGRDLINACCHDNLQQDLAGRRMANPMDPVLGHYTSQQNQPAAVPDHRTINLISHPSKVMLKITLNRLKPQAEKIIAKERVSFRIGRSTTE